MGNYIRIQRPHTVIHVIHNDCIRCHQTFVGSFRSGVCPSCHQTLLRQPYTNVFEKDELDELDELDEIN
jgi:hypothetical protein